MDLKGNRSLTEEIPQIEKGHSGLPKSFTSVTSLSKIIALILFVTLPFIGGYIGYKFGRNTVVPAPYIGETKTLIPSPLSVNPTSATSNDTTITLSGFDLSIPSNWKLDKIDPTYGAVITTQTLPYNVTLMLKIVKVMPGEVLKGDKVGYTADGAGINEEAGIGGAKEIPYIVTYPNGDTFSFQWDVKSTQTNPEADGIWSPDHDFKQSDLLHIVESSKKS